MFARWRRPWMNRQEQRPRQFQPVVESLETRTLLSFVGSMAEMAGKKVIVMVSASLAAEPGREAYTLEAELEGPKASLAAGEVAPPPTSRDIFGETISPSGCGNCGPNCRCAAICAPTKAGRLCASGSSARR